MTPMVRRTSSGSVMHIVPTYAGRSGGNRDERSHHADQRGFPRSVRTQESKYFFFFYVEGNVIHGRELAILLDDVVYFDGIARVDRFSSYVSRWLAAAGSPIRFEVSNHVVPSIQLHLRTETISGN